MRYHLFQKIFEEVVKIKETSFLLSKCLISIAHNCISKFIFLLYSCKIISTTLEVTSQLISMKEANYPVMIGPQKCTGRQLLKAGKFAEQCVIIITQLFAKYLLIAIKDVILVIQVEHTIPFYQENI